MSVSPEAEKRVVPPELPVLPLPEAVVFPRVRQPLLFGRGSALRLLESLQPESLVVLVAQRSAEVASPSLADLFPVGTLARVLHVSHIEEDDESLTVLVEGLQRVRLVSVTQREPFLKALVEPVDEHEPPADDPEFVALRQSVREAFSEIVLRSPVLPNELAQLALKAEGASFLADLVATHLPALSTAQRQHFLELPDARQRLHELMDALVRQREVLRLQDELESQVQEKLGKSQREFFLREELKAIQKELGENDADRRTVDELRSRFNRATLPEEARREALRELDRLEGMPVAAAEYSVARTYLDWILSLPWQRQTAQRVDIRRAEQILDEDHYDLEKAKARILEYLAVLQLKPEMKGPILCFVGPPGTGKTSVGKSIARALGRAFVRLSLGGMHDEGEIRGHRRTYVGALPGQILQGLRRAGTSDPVFMLDEVDKLGRDFHGDPAAALLEVLDPDQNVAFRDHYIDLPFDLSKVMFITTANVLDPVPPSLVDRMEVLELPGYTEEEKLEIARRYLVPRQVDAHGLATRDVTFDEAALREIISSYTREAGVRNLDRELAALCRKHAREVAAGGPPALAVTPDVVRARLGAPRFQTETELEDRTRRPGVAVGLAWTPQGGDVLFIEAARMPRDKGEFTITGQVGPVMQESTHAALSWLRANAGALGLDPEAFKRYDLHIHVPSGAVPKDGPSAGLALVAALASLFADRPVRPFVAMTGEVTLSGLVLPVGGIKEKVLAARRSGVREIVLPAANEAQLIEDVPPHLRRGISFHLVRTIEEALAHAIGAPLTGADRQAPETTP